MSISKTLSELRGTASVAITLVAAIAFCFVAIYAIGASADRQPIGPHQLAHLISQLEQYPSLKQPIKQATADNIVTYKEYKKLCYLIKRAELNDLKFQLKSKAQ